MASLIVVRSTSALMLGANAKGAAARVGSVSAVEERVFTLADQAARFERAKEEGNTRYLDIKSVYDGAYLKGKRVLITGAGRGLGLAMAREISAQGADGVYLVRKRTSELEALGGQIIEGVDVMSEESVNKAMESILKPVDIVINNAGLFSAGAAERRRLATTVPSLSHPSPEPKPLLRRRRDRLDTQLCRAAQDDRRVRARPATGLVGRVQPGQDRRGRAGHRDHLAGGLGRVAGHAEQGQGRRLRPPHEPRRLQHRRGTPPLRATTTIAPSYHHYSSELHHYI